MKHLFMLLSFFSLTAQAADLSQTISFSMQDVRIEGSRSSDGSFSQIQISGFENSKQVGAPALPMQSWLLVGTPETIQPQIEIISSETLPNIRPMPVQKQKCRCALDQDNSFQFDLLSYIKDKDFELTYLGAYRGTPVTRLDVPLARYNAVDNAVKFINNFKVTHNAPIFSSNHERATYNDYLIITPATLADGIKDFVAWKSSQGYKINVETLRSPELTIKNVSDIVARNYKSKGIDFVIIIGDENIIPMHSVKTSGGSTPSDFNYFIMDGPKDVLPDMFYGRIAADSPAEVKATLAKSIESDKQNYKDAKGLRKMIGVASNEQGSGPSDEEYVKSIENKFNSVLGFQASHFGEDSKNSNPTEFNKAYSSGVSWTVYMGHGSGQTWPSFYSEYATSDIANISNKDTVKPIMIDVACQNGRLTSGYIGTSFSSVLSNKAYGAVAYYGGSVNISWDPPAVMARGIYFEHAEKNFRHLGEAIFAGQLYLAANWNKKDEVLDNFEWYHLQGDPGLWINH